MKRLFILMVCVWGCEFSYPQTDQHVPLNFIEKARSQNEFSCEATIVDFGKNPYSKKKLQKITGVNSEFFTSCFWFKIKGDPKKYFLPVNDKSFNYDYFDKKIYPLIKNNQNLQIIFSIKVYVHKNELYFIIKRIYLK